MRRGVRERAPSGRGPRLGALRRRAGAGRPTAGAPAAGAARQAAMARVAVGRKWGSPLGGVRGAQFTMRVGYVLQSKRGAVDH